MRTQFIAGNWKMNTNKSTAIALARVVGAGAPGGVTLGVAPPFPYIDAVGQALSGSRVRLGAQDAYFESDGAFTGEVSLAMLRDLGVDFVLTGHSERRHVIGETPELIGRKASAILKAGMTLIHCIGEKIEQREAGQTDAVCKAQLHELPGDLSDPGKLVIAYEPVWAIGTGKVATDAMAQETHAYIRTELAAVYGGGFADAVVIQYGGSMKPENARGLLSQKDIDGGLIGGAALKAESFLAIARAAL